MTDTPHKTVSQRRAHILDRLSAIGAGSTTLVAASKRQPEDAINAALASGHRVFGENRVQEAQARWGNRRREYPDLELRLIGPLQSNKSEDAVRLFDTIETLDRPKLAHALAAAMGKTGVRPRVLIQVNTGEEAQKAGVSPAALEPLLALCRQTLDLPIQGLMCIPPVDEPAGPHFALLAKLAATYGLTELSMGMSGDYELAAALGSTHVRVGTAFFGPRPD